MKKAKRLLHKTISNILSNYGFQTLNHGAEILWNMHSTVCCIVNLKTFNNDSYATLEIGFVAPQILEWFGIQLPKKPTAALANGVGIHFRLEDLCNQDNFIFPPGGWLIAEPNSEQDFERFLESQLPIILPPILSNLLTLDGWIAYFRSELNKHSKGRGILWSMLAYSMLANEMIPNNEIKNVIDLHTQEDDKQSSQNKLNVHIQRQLDFLTHRSL